MLLQHALKDSSLSQITVSSLKEALYYIQQHESFRWGEYSGLLHLLGTPSNLLNADMRAFNLFCDGDGQVFMPRFVVSVAFMLCGSAKEKFELCFDVSLAGERGLIPFDQACSVLRFVPHVYS